MPAPSPRERSTSWSTVVLSIGAGLIAGAQVGKGHIALPSLRHSFSITLIDASWILSALSWVGLLVATFAGAWAAKRGNRKAVALGLLIIALAGGAGALSPSALWLVLTRVCEGIGFVIVVVAAPSLIVERTDPADVRLALSGWATYMPAGIALVTVLGPLLLATHSWRALWSANAVAAAIFAVVVLVVVRERKAPIVTRERQPWQEVKAVLGARGPVLLAVIFGTYTLQHLGVMGFLPTVLIENYRVAPQRAGLLVSVAMAANIVGNLAAGVLLEQRVRRSLLIAVTMLFMAAMTFGIFSAHLSFHGVYLCAFLFSCVGGLVPACVISAAPFHSPSAELIPATNGLLVQGSNLGMVLGPPLIGWLATRHGWTLVPVATVGVAALAAVLAAGLNRRELSPEAQEGQPLQVSS